MADINIVKGNPCPLSIPLQRQSVEVTSVGAKPVVKDFFPGSGAPVKVLLQCGAYRQQQMAVMDGNIAIARFDATLDTGVYGIEVVCQDSDGEPCRWKRAEAVEVHDESIRAGLDPGVEFDGSTYRMDAAIFPGVVTYGGGGKAAVKAAVDTRPIVHRAIPERPQPGSRYYFEEEVRLMFRSVEAAISALEAMELNTYQHVMVFAEGHHISFETLEELSERLEEMPHGRERCFQVCLSAEGWRHKLVICDQDHCLKQDGTIDYGALMKGINKPGMGITSETRSPNFRIENGHVMCVAECDRALLNEMFKGYNVATYAANRQLRFNTDDKIFHVANTGKELFSNRLKVEMYDRSTFGDEEPVALSPGRQLVLTNMSYYAQSIESYNTNFDGKRRTIIGEVISFIDKQYKGQEWDGSNIYIMTYSFKVYGYGFPSKGYMKNMDAYMSVYNAEENASLSEFQKLLERMDRKLFITKKTKWVNDPYRNGKQRRMRMALDPFRNKDRARNIAGPYCFHRIMRRKYKSVKAYKGMAKIWQEERSGYVYFRLEII